MGPLLNSAVSTLINMISDIHRDKTVSNNIPYNRLSKSLRSFFFLVLLVLCKAE